jgi:hypothetical protein
MAKGSIISPFKVSGLERFVGSMTGITREDIERDGFGLLGKSRKRIKAEREIAAAEADVEAGIKAYEDFEFQTVNPFRDGSITNPYATMQVNLQAAEFQRQQQEQEQADLLAALSGGAGGAGAAALATSLARVGQQKQQAIAADIGRQEQAIGMAKAGFEGQIQMSGAQAEMANLAASQQFNIERMETILGIDMAKVTGLQQAEQARKDRNAQIAGQAIGAVGNVVPSFI